MQELLIEGVRPRLGTKIGSDHALWTWAARHASWALNRFHATPMSLYGEPVHGYIKSLSKGARWHLCLFLRKVERQDAYVLTDGVQVVLSKRIRRTDHDGS